MSLRSPTENEIALTPALPADWAREFSMQRFSGRRPLAAWGTLRVSRPLLFPRGVLCEVGTVWRRDAGTNVVTNLINSSKLVCA